MLLALLEWPFGDLIFKAICASNASLDYVPDHLNSKFAQPQLCLLSSTSLKSSHAFQLSYTIPSPELLIAVQEKFGSQPLFESQRAQLRVTQVYPGESVLHSEEGTNPEDENSAAFLQYQVHLSLDSQPQSGICASSLLSCGPRSCSSRIQTCPVLWQSRSKRGDTDPACVHIATSSAELTDDLRRIKSAPGDV